MEDSLFWSALRLKDTAKKQNLLCTPIHKRVCYFSDTVIKSDPGTIYFKQLRVHLLACFSCPVAAEQSFRVVDGLIFILMSVLQYRMIIMCDMQIFAIS